MTASYSVVLKTSVERELRALLKEDLRRVVDLIRGLAHNPRPAGHEKLTGQERYRIRQGDYRVMYAIDVRLESSRSSRSAIGGKSIGKSSLLILGLVGRPLRSPAPFALRPVHSVRPELVEGPVLSRVEGF